MMEEMTEPGFEHSFWGPSVLTSHQCTKGVMLSALSLRDEWPGPGDMVNPKVPFPPAPQTPPDHPNPAAARTPTAAALSPCPPSVCPHAPACPGASCQADLCFPGILGWDAFSQHP